MLANLYNLGTGTYVVGEEILKKLHMRIGRIGIMLVFLVFVMWVLNVAGLEKLNWLFFFLAAGFLLYIGTAPRLLAYSMVLGSTVAAFKDEDVSKGAVKGLVVLFGIVLAAVFWVCGIAAFLALWSFAKAPFAFIPFAGMMLLLAVAFAYFKMESGKTLGRIVVAVALVVAAIALAQSQGMTFKSPFQWPWSTSADIADSTPCERAVCTTISSSKGRTFKPKQANAPFTWTRDDNSNGVLGVRFNGGKERKWLPGGLLPFDHTVSTFTVRRLSGDPVSIILGTPNEVEVARTEYAHSDL